MTELEKKVKIVDNFLSNKNWEGVCGYWMVEDEKGPNVVIVIDLVWLENIQFKPEFVAKRLRDEVREEIKNWTNIDAYVGSTAKDCRQIEN